MRILLKPISLRFSSFQLIVHAELCLAYLTLGPSKPPSEQCPFRHSTIYPFNDLIIFSSHEVAAGGERAALGQRERRFAEVHRHDRAVRKRRALHEAVGGKDAVVKHFAVAGLPGDGRGDAVAAHEAILVRLPLLRVEEVHAHRAVEDVEEVALVPEGRQLVIVVAPVPVRAEAVVATAVQSAHRPVCRRAAMRGAKSRPSMVAG